MLGDIIADSRATSPGIRTPDYPRSGSLAEAGHYRPFRLLCGTDKWKDYRAKGDARYKLMTLDADEFIRRFLIHVLPDGFHRIRHYGLFANSRRAENIARARQLLNVPAPQNALSDTDSTGDGEPRPSSHPCPCCGGRMIIIEIFECGCSPRYHPTVPNRVDSS